MAPTLPLNIPIPPSQALANYDFNDISSGLGYIKYDLFTTSLSGTTAFGLTTNSVYSYDISTTDTAGDPEINFDSSAFNLPRTASGTAYANLGFGITGSGTGNVQVILYKVNSAGTETALSALLSGANIGGAATTVGMWLVPMALTQTIIKKDEYLRLGVTITGDGADIHELGHDPKGRDGLLISGGTATTISSVYVPFRINT